jgi:hypothetical protein
MQHAVKSKMRGGVHMQLTVAEMQLLCVFYAGNLPATLEAVQHAAKGAQNHHTKADFESLAEKLSQMKDGDTAFLAFEAAK